MSGRGTVGALAADGLLPHLVHATKAERVSDEDGRLLVAALAGDAQAFTAMYRQWQGPLYRFALHMAGSESLAEDVTQEVFLALVEEGDRFDPDKGRFSSYVFGIARNRLRRRLRREGIYASSGAPGDDDGAPSGAALTFEDRASALAIDRRDDPATDPDRALDRQEAIRQVRRAICQLPVGFREAVVLCDLQELSYADAAAILGCPVGTVRSRLYRGRQLLADHLRPVVATTSNTVSDQGEQT